MAYGDITAGLIDTSSQTGTDPYICHVAGNVYALVTGKTTVRTYTVSPAGVITDAAIDTLSISAANGVGFPTITKIASGMYALLGDAGDTMGWRIITVGIDDAGQIDAAVTEKQDGDATYDYGYPSENGLLHVFGDVWAFAIYNEWGTAPTQSNGPVIRTVTITAAGAVSGTIDLLAIATTTGSPGFSYDFQYHFFHISGNLYGIIYTGGWEDASVTVKTFTIANDGTISAVVDTEVIDTYIDPAYPPVGSPMAFHVSGNIWAFAYNASTDAATLVTYNIGTDGTITDSPEDAWVFDATSYAGGWLVPIHSDTNRWTFFYRADNATFEGVTLTISNAGVITESLFSNQGFSISDPRPGNMLHVVGNCYLLAIDGAATSTTLATLNVSAALLGGFIQII